MDDEAFEIVHEETERSGRYVVRTPGAPDAEMTWHRSAPGTIVIDHTFVPPELRNSGLALKLVERGIADARERGLKVVPACSYVAIQFRRHREWADLLAD